MMPRRIHGAVVRLAILAIFAVAVTAIVRLLDLIGPVHTDSTDLPAKPIQHDSGAQAPARSTLLPAHASMRRTADYRAVRFGRRHPDHVAVTLPPSTPKPRAVSKGRIHFDEWSDSSLPSTLHSTPRLRGPPTASIVATLPHQAIHHESSSIPFRVRQTITPRNGGSIFRGRVIPE